MTAVVEEYEAAERAYLAAVKGGQPTPALEAAAKMASRTASAWEAQAYREFFAARDAQGAESRDVVEKEIEAEKAELLRELWTDIAAAHTSASG